jgi:heptosyltransferase-3
MTTHHQRTKTRRAMLRLEAKLGRSLSRIFRFSLTRIVRALFARESGLAPERILLVRTGMIGDTICALPALAWLRQEFPQSKIALLTAATASPELWMKDGFVPGSALLDSKELIDEIILFDGRDVTRPRKLLALRRQIRRFDPDRTYILPRSGERPARLLKKILLVRILGVRKNVAGYELEKFFTIFRRAQFLDGGFDHQVTACRKAVGAPATDPVSFPLRVAPEARRRIERFWREHGLESRRVIGLFAGGKFAHKRWPIENYAQFCRIILREPKLAIVLLGGPADAVQASELAAQCPGWLWNFCGQTSLGETAEILRRCELYVGNDSGPAHIAAAAGTPCVTLFSSIVFPGIWEPWGAPNISLRHRVACEYCFSEDHCPRETMECIRGITVEVVVRAALGLLSKSWRESPRAQEAAGVALPVLGGNESRIE